MHNARGNNGKSGRKTNYVQGGKVDGRVSFVLRLVKSAVRDNEGNIIRKASVVEGDSGTDGHILGEECVGDYNTGVSGENNLTACVTYSRERG